MSRGPGIRQRQILEYLGEHLMAELKDIIAHYEGCNRSEIPDSLLKSYERARRKLINAKAVAFVYFKDEQYWRERSDYRARGYNVRYRVGHYALTQNLRAARIQSLQERLDEARKEVRRWEQMRFCDSGLRWAKKDVERYETELARLASGGELERPSTNDKLDELLDELNALTS